MLAFEAYRCRADLYDVHLQSPAMKTAFLPAAQPAMTTGLDLTHFAAVGGFLDLGGVRAECGVMNHVRIRCVDAEARRVLLGRLERLCDGVEERMREGGSGEVFTFLGLRSLDDEVGASIFARYESREAWERWLREDMVVAFWSDVKDCVATMEARGYAPNGKGWLWK